MFILLPEAVSQLTNLSIDSHFTDEKSVAHRGQGSSSQGTQLVVEEGLEPQHPTAIQRFILD